MEVLFARQVVQDMARVKMTARVLVNEDTEALTALQVFLKCQMTSSNVKKSFYVTIQVTVQITELVTLATVSVTRDSPDLTAPSVFSLIPITDPSLRCLVTSY